MTSRCSLISMTITDQPNGGKYEPVLIDNAYKVVMKLSIKVVSQADFGSYKCIAKNSLGETDGTIKLYSKDCFPIDSCSCGKVEFCLPLLTRSRPSARRSDKPANGRTGNSLPLSTVHCRAISCPSLPLPIGFYGNRCFAVSELPKSAINSVEAFEGRRKSKYNNCDKL
ncbi:conserved hypothetical protein [Culex quinquefasciatus]|uniref:Immunoglobulin I-set domain-containing protein n=1 Tax=Culex quinquefasciatus TaxID=7176 RepID=B0WPE6_CULQU|nr:conserved hypothetical protein [Culex quinquefasciatus]|eukprot:XP_001850580.1 conserved hypothetical protein [Culex quinquefasciatus]